MHTQAHVFGIKAQGSTQCRHGKAGIKHMMSKEPTHSRM